MHADIHDHAREDLDRVWESDPRAAAVIEVLMEQLQLDPDVVDKLTSYGDNRINNVTVNVKPWQGLLSTGNFWRFRAIETAATGYRVIYVYHWQTRQLVFLAVVDKDDGFNYDDHSSDIIKRIISDARDI